MDKIWKEKLAKIMSIYLDGSNWMMVDVVLNISANTLPLAVKHS
jgi:hypothetical protein